MKIDKNKICIIICVNSDFQFTECLNYINYITVPAGMELEILEIRNAGSMAAGYQEGMEASDAKYKIYMHQDVRLASRRIFEYILRIFNENKNIGMLGMVGTPEMPADGVMWHRKRVFTGEGVTDKELYKRVEAIDGYFMATQYDLAWRTDLFDGWDFYDASQAFEFRKMGYEVVVPCDRVIWAVHEDKPCVYLWNYDKYRQVFIDNYL